jgi:hypothetical protein
MTTAPVTMTVAEFRSRWLQVGWMEAATRGLADEDLVVVTVKSTAVGRFALAVEPAK